MRTYVVQWNQQKKIVCSVYCAIPIIHFTFIIIFVLFYYYFSRLTSAMENEQLFVQEPGFINDELNVNLKNTPTNISTATTFCSCKDQASNTESLNDFNIMHCNLTESTEFCSSSLQSGYKIHSYSTSCKISDRKTAFYGLP